MEPGPCIVCGKPSHNGHHRKLRSQGGGEEHWNILRVCGSGTTGCHGLIHANPEAAYESGLLVHSFDDPREIPVRPEIFRELLAEEFVDAGLVEVAASLMAHQHEGVPEGEKCPTCKRRVPHKKKKTSPVTKVKAFRVPVGDVETLEEQMETAAEYLGCHKKPHWQFWLLQYALVALLQNQEFEGALADKEWS